MTNQNPPGHKNPTFVNEEAGRRYPDNRSSSSTSSRSTSTVQRLFDMKLVSSKKVRLLALAVGLAVAAVLIISITVAVYVTGNDRGDDSGLTQVDGEGQSGASGSPPSSSGLSTSTYSMTSTTVLTTSQLTNTSPKTSPTPPRSTSTTTESPQNVRMKDVHMYPGRDSITLTCLAKHTGSWRSLAIRKVYTDGVEPVAFVVNTDDTSPEVHVLPRNASHVLTMDTYSINFTVVIDSFHCRDVSNYSCVMELDDRSVKRNADVFVHMDGPVIDIPHVVVEDREVTLMCTVETVDAGASLKWQIRTAVSDMFLDFSNEPFETKENNNCTTTITSNVTFSPTMYENASDFRCVLEGTPPYVQQDRQVDTQLLVVQKSFCEGRRQYTVHSHPYRPCSLVIYCLDTGPLVYEIECELEHCYDAKMKKCLPVDQNG